VFFLAVSVSNLAIAVAADVRKIIVAIESMKPVPIDLRRTTKRAAVEDNVALKGAPQRIRLILAVAAVYFLAVATVAVDAV
jgi:hypothetical protein